MGRSVSVPCTAVEVIYFPVWDYREEDEEFDSFLAELAFDDMIANLKSVLKDVDDSLDDADRWIGREDHVFLDNTVVDVSLSEYCGLCALAFVPKEDADDDAWWPVQEQWEEFAGQRASDIANQVRANLEGFDVLRKLGTFSNGEAVFERAG